MRIRKNDIGDNLAWALQSLPLFDDLFLGVTTGQARHRLRKVRHDCSAWETTASLTCDVVPIPQRPSSRQTTTLTMNELRDNDDSLDGFLGEELKDNWEKMITWKAVKEVRADVEKVIRKLNAAADPKGDPFAPGISSHSAKLEST